MEISLLQPIAERRHLRRILKICFMLATAVVLFEGIAAYADEMPSSLSADAAHDDASLKTTAGEDGARESAAIPYLTDDVVDSSTSSSDADSASAISDSLLVADVAAPRTRGWVDAGGSRYYYGDEGRALTGSQYIDGCWYRFDPVDGHMLTGWQVIDGKRYYYGDDGALYFKNHCIDGDWYWFDINEGWMWTGSANIYGGWYRYDLEDGRMLFGSQCIDGDWYRYDLGCGRMLFGSQCIDGGWYRYDLGCGKMLFGSQYIDGNWYWYDLGCGKMLFGWQNIYGHWYYYDLGAGFMYLGQRTINGAVYLFDESQGYFVGGEILSYPYSFDQAVNAELATGVYSSESKLREAMDPSFNPSHYYSSYVFQRLDTGYSGTSPSAINDYINRNCIYRELATGRVSSLRNAGDAIVAASKACNVNEVYILAHAILESGWGCSDLSTGNVSGYEGYYNFFGIGAYDIDPNNGGAALAKKSNWITPASAIQGGAQWIAQHYIFHTVYLENGNTTTQNTLYKMRFAPGLQNVWHQYATSLTWHRSIANLMGDIYFSLNNSSVVFEIPAYS